MKSYRILQVKLYFWSLLLALYCYCRENVKYGPFSKHFLQRTQEHDGWKSLRSNDKLFKKQCLSVITQNKKHSSKQVIPITYTLGKRFVAAVTFEGLSVASLRREYKKMQFCLVCMSSLYISTEKKTVWMMFMWGKFSFLHADI